MTPQEREVMQMALDALDKLLDKLNADICDNSGIWDEYCDGGNAMQALRARLAQPEPEPWGYISHKSWKMPVFVEADDLQAANLPFNNPDYTPVYKAPPQREWQGLTDEEIEQGMKQAYSTVQGRNLEVAFARAIEAKLKEKNT